MLIKVGKHLMCIWCFKVKSSLLQVIESLRLFTSQPLKHKAICFKKVEAHKKFNP